MKFFAPTSLWRFAGAEFSAIAASGPRARVCDVTGCETFWLGSSAEPNFSRWAAAREIDPTSRATASLSRTRRGTRVTRGFARESHRIPGTDGDGDMGEVKLPEDVKEQLEKEYWENMSNAVGEKNFRVWSQLERSMERYREMLMKRRDSLRDAESLREQNDELRGLLSQYLSSSVNDELMVPPAAYL